MHSVGCFLKRIRSPLAVSSSREVPRNVSEAVDPPKAQREEVRPLSPEQARRLLEAARGDRLEALYVLAVHCGLHQGELLGLRWEDVDLEAGTLHVRRTLTLAKDGPKFMTPKTAKSRRQIRFTTGAVEALKRHHDRQFEECTRLTGLWQDYGLVFVTTIGLLSIPATLRAVHSSRCSSKPDCQPNASTICGTPARRYC